MRLVLLLSASLAMLGLAALPVRADEVTGTGTLVMNDHFHTETKWGESLVLPKAGKIVRVMDQAVGMSLPAGTYILDPYVCKQHRHHHIEVTAAY